VTGRTTMLVGAAALATATLALAHPKQFSPWSPAVNAETAFGGDVNSPYLDGCPNLSPDGLSLWTASDRPGGLGGLDIWVAHRPSRRAPFDPPVNAGEPINSAADDFCPSPMRGGWFFWVSARPGGCGAADIYVTRRDGDAWQAPLHLNCTVNSAAVEASPYLLRRGGYESLYFSSNRPDGFAPGGTDSDVYFSKLGHFGFGAAQLAPGLNTAADDSRPNLRSDGREIVFDSTRGGGAPDVWSSTRAHVEDDWSAPVNLGSNVNTPSSESRASLPWDRKTLVFGSNRPGSEPTSTGPPSTDVYVSTRERLQGDDDE
jgi:WD40-like Beta Propeller Repeat